MSIVTTRQAINVRNQNPRVVQKNQNTFSRPPIVSVRKCIREITPSNNVERNKLIDEVYSRLSDPVKLLKFAESLQRDPPQSKFVNGENNTNENGFDWWQKHFNSIYSFFAVNPFVLI